MGSNDVRARAERDAFVSHMASVGVTDVAWTAEMGPVGYRDDHHAMLSVEWERFAAGYRAALAAAAADASASPVDATAVAPATAVEEARQNFTVCALAFMQSPDRDAMGAIRLMHEAYRRYVAAEAADEGHTRVEESRSDDRPAKGQGGV